MHLYLAQYQRTTRAGEVEKKIKQNKKLIERVHLQKRLSLFLFISLNYVFFFSSVHSRECQSKWCWVVLIKYQQFFKLSKIMCFYFVLKRRQSNCAGLFIVRMFFICSCKWTHQCGFLFVYTFHLVDVGHRNPTNLFIWLPISMKMIPPYIH